MLTRRGRRAKPQDQTCSDFRRRCVPVGIGMIILMLCLLCLCPVVTVVIAQEAQEEQAADATIHLDCQRNSNDETKATCSFIIPVAMPPPNHNVGVQQEEPVLQQQYNYQGCLVQPDETQPELCLEGNVNLFWKEPRHVHDDMNDDEDEPVADIEVPPVQDETVQANEASVSQSQSTQPQQQQQQQQQQQENRHGKKKDDHYDMFAMPPPSVSSTADVTKRPTTRYRPPKNLFETRTPNREEDFIQVGSVQYTKPLYQYGPVVTEVLMNRPRSVQWNSEIESEQQVQVKLKQLHGDKYQEPVKNNDMASTLLLARAQWLQRLGVAHKSFLEQDQLHDTATENPLAARRRKTQLRRHAHYGEVTLYEAWDNMEEYTKLLQQSGVPHSMQAYLPLADIHFALAQVLAFGTAYDDDDDDDDETDPQKADAVMAQQQRRTAKVDATLDHLRRADDMYQLVVDEMGNGAWNLPLMDHNDPAVDNNEWSEADRVEDARIRDSGDKDLSWEQRVNARDTALAWAHCAMRVGVFLIDASTASMSSSSLMINMEHIDLNNPADVAFLQQEQVRLQKELLERVQEARGHFRQAKHVFGRALRLDETGQLPLVPADRSQLLRHYGSACQNAATAAQSSADWATAETEYQEAQKAYRKALRGLAAERGGDYNDKDGSWIEADTVHAAGEALAGLADVALQQGRYLPAKRYYRDAMAWMESHNVAPPPDHTATMTAALGGDLSDWVSEETAQTMAEYERALEEYQNLFAEGVDRTDGAYVAAATAGGDREWMMDGDRDTYYQRDDDYEADLHATLGALYLGTGDLYQTRSHLQQALQLYRGVPHEEAVDDGPVDDGDDRSVADVQYNIALLERMQGHYMASAAAYDRAMDIFDRVIGEGVNPFYDLATSWGGDVADASVGGDDGSSSASGTASSTSSSSSSSLPYNTRRPDTTAKAGFTTNTRRRRSRSSPSNDDVVGPAAAEKETTKKSEATTATTSDKNPPKTGGGGGRSIHIDPAAYMADALHNETKNDDAGVPQSDEL